MALPACPHCQATKFAITEDEPLGAAYKIYLVHCVGCGAPVGAMEYVVTGAVLANQEKTLAKIQTTLSGLETRLRRIEQALTRQ